MDLGLIEQNKKKMMEEVLLLKQDTVFETIGRINGYHDEIHRHIMHVVDCQLRNGVEIPPFSYCWIEMGSGGREERTLWTDQDNGMIYDSETSNADFLMRASHKVVQLLSEWGYPLCNGGVMASNPRWLQPSEGWKRNWTHWNEELTLDSIRYLLIAWDMRPMYGEERLVREFKQWGLNQMKTGISRLASHGLHHPLPIGIFGRLFTPTHGENTGLFHLKEGGYYQLVSLVRLLSIDGSILESSTRSRITALAKVGYLSQGAADELEDALAFFLYLRLKHHADLFLQRKPFHDFISLAGYDKRMLAQLKHHIKNIKKHQNCWKKEFGIRGGEDR